MTDSRDSRDEERVLDTVRGVDNALDGLTAALDNFLDAFKASIGPQQQ